MLQPAKVKWRKMQKGRRKGTAWRGSSLAFGDFVEFFFHACGKLNIDNFREMFDKNIVYDKTNFGRLETFGFVFFDVVSILNGGDGWRVGGRATDAVFFECFNE